MKKLESKLKRLHLKVPSGSLDSRVLSQKPLHSTQPDRERWRVPVWAAALIAIASGVAGFVGGVASKRGEPTGQLVAPSPMNVQVIYDSPGSRNPFDFTRASHFFPGDEIEISETELQPTA